VDSRKDYYATLGVARNAEAVVIRAAYKALSQRYHPDKCPPSERAAANRRMAEINEAFDVLSDLALRRSYDEQHSFEPQEPEAPFVTPRVTRFRALLAPLVIVILTMFFALEMAVEKKAWWTFTWAFISDGLQRPSSYSVNWFLLTVIVGLGLRLAWVVHRRLIR
jgi:preprotein translocase subunit Sec63